MLTQIWSTGISVLFLFSGAYAQSSGLFQQLPEEKQNIIETISLYPADQRMVILQASAHPEILVRMENIRTNTEDQFKNKISGLSEEDQKRIYNLARYPALMNAITSNATQRSDREMTDLLQNYTEDIHPDAAYINSHYFDLLQDINQLYADANQDFQKMLSSYPPDVQQTYTELSKLPEIVSLLTKNLDLTILLGDEYSKNPKRVTIVLDSLNVVVAEAQAKDLNAWKKELEGNPAAMTEYEASAKEFAGDEGYDNEVYNGTVPENQAQNFYAQQTRNYYPYWFGSPSWYGYEMWYPYPYWYHSGFYYGPHHNLVIWGFPSDFYMYWYFWYDPHLYYYPHYADHIIRHYHGPHHIGSRLQPVYRQWENHHQSDLPKNWFHDDAQRVDRIKEYGKFSMDYEKKVQQNVDKSPTPREYLETHSKRYPTLKPVLTEKPAPVESTPYSPRDYSPGQTKRPEYNPPVYHAPSQYKPAQQNAPAGSEKPKKEKQPPKDTAPSKKDQSKSPPKDAPPQKGKDNTQPSPVQPKKG